MANNVSVKHYSRIFLKTGLILVSLFAIHFFSFGQADTSKSMSFDFGITRDRNINLWPIFKRTISDYESDKQFLFPFYRSYQNFKLGEKRNHLFPIYWQDSSKNDENKRYISTFYPSLIHISKDYKFNTQTFTFLEFAPRINLLEFKKSPDGLVMQNNLLFFLWYKNNQISKKSYLIVFPIYWQFKSPLRETSILFPLYTYGSNLHGKNKYLAVTPLYWHFESPKRYSNLLLPFWWNRSMVVGTDSIKNNLVFPIYYSHKSQNTNNKVFFPLIWSLKNPSYESLTIAPLLSYGHGTYSDRQHLMISPLFWHFKNEEGENTTLFPLVWKSSWNTRYEHYSSLVILPFYWSKQNNTESNTVILPFIWERNTADYYSLSVIPFVSVGQSPDNTYSHIAITPLFWHIKTAKGFSNTLFPIWWYSKKNAENDIRIKNNIFPLYWSWKNQKKQGNIFFPIVWNFKNSNYKTFTLFPLILTGKSTDNSRFYTAITPFYWKFRTSDGNGKLLFPIWWQKDKTLQGELISSSQVFTLYWKYKDAERRHQGIFPLLWQFRKQDRNSFTFFPFISVGKRDSGNRKYFAVTPLLWHLKNKQQTFNTFFPIWWNTTNYSSKNVKHFSLVVPIYFSQWDTIRSRKVIFPLIWSFKNPQYNSFTFIPFLSYGGTKDRSIHHLALTPLFWHVKNFNGYTTTFFPLIWNSSYTDGIFISKRTVVFPIYWFLKDNFQQNRIIFPVLWSLNSNNYKSFTLAPLFSFGRNSDYTKHHYTVTPFYYNIKTQNTSTQLLFPLWWNISKSNKNGFSNVNVLFPLYWSFSNQHNSNKVVFPIAWKFQNAQSHSFTFAPFFSSGSSKYGTKHLMITPLFWKFDSNEKHTTILFPLFTTYNDTLHNRQFDIMFFLFRRNKSPETSNYSIVWPILEHTRSSNYQYFRFAPLVWSKKSPEFSYFTIQPFFYHSESNNRITNRILWELYVYRNQKGIKKSNSILWKFVNWNRYTNGDREFRILYLLYANSEVDGKVEKSFFPLYYYTADNKGNRSLSVMLYFYNSLKRKIPNTSEYYQEERIFWLIRFRSNYQMLKNKGIEVN